MIASDTLKSQTALIEAVLETVQGMSVIKSFNLTGKGDKKLQDALEFNRRSNVEVSDILTPYTALQEAVLQIAGVGMMLAAVLFWRNGAMSLANALMVLVMSFLVFNQIKAFGMGVSMLRLAAAAIDRTEETEDMPRMDENGKALSPEKHDIVFDHVNFSYEQKPILRDISVTLPDKTTTAVIDPSGSGKTTFCNLIARFWDTDSGSVKFGGYAVKDYTLESLMEQISVVFQNVYLFSDTIENNIKFGKPEATHDEVVAAAKAACCDDFIGSLPDGYQTVIGDDGGSLSQGQKQLLCIARVFLCLPPMLILDEATSSIDTRTEMKIQNAFAKLMQGRTSFIVAHRLSTIKEADIILVMRDGHIVEQGDHETLLRRNGFYAQLYNSQFEA